MNAADLTVFGSTAVTEGNTHFAKLHDSIAVEETFNALAEDPCESLLQITEFNYETINPVLRQPIFYMPGKRRRPASKYYFQLVAKTKKCLCKKYPYKLLRDSLFRVVDRALSKMIDDFAFRTRKTQMFHLDIDHLQDLVSQGAQAQDLFCTEQIEANARNRLAQQIEDFWLQRIKRQYLTMANAQDEARQQLSLLQTKDYAIDKVLPVVKQMKQSFEAVIVMAQMRVCGSVFQYKTDQELNSLTERLKGTAETAVKYRKIMFGRVQQHKHVLNDISVAQSTNASRVYSLASDGDRWLQNGSSLL